MINNYKQKIRTALAAICLFASFSSVMAQVSAYSFSSASVGYVPITGGTNLSSTPTTNIDDNNYSSLPIGFSFNFNGTDYTDFGINANGWITMGNLTPNNSYSAISGGISNNVICGFNTDLLGRLHVTANRTNGSNEITVTAGNISAFEIGDLVAGTGIPASTTITNIAGNIITISNNATSNGTGFNFRVWKPSTGIRYETIGIAPNRKLIVQWSHFCRYSTAGGSINDNINFQIILNETTNVIETVYNIPNASTFGTYPNGQIGLKGATNLDFNNRATTTDWSSTIAGTLNTSSVELSTTVFPSVGLTYSWTPPSTCSGTPAAGIANGPATVCSGVNFNLSLTGSESGVSDLTYQWQSSPDGTTYTDISGANSATYTANQSSSTFYQCIVTCTSSSEFAISTPINVGMSNFINCYCSTGLTTTGGVTDAVTNVVITNSLSNNITQASSGATPWYTAYSNTPLDLVLGSSNTVAITMGSDNNQHSAVWVDWNQNGIFEASENVALSTSVASGNTTVTYTFTVPLTATLGNTRIRIRGGSDGAYTAAGACSGTGYGETEDYLVNIICPTMVAPAVTGGAACAGNTVNLSATATYAGATLTWYDAAVAGTVVNTGATFTTPILVANTSYWVSETITGCTESPLAEVIASISPVDAVLSAINVTCNGLGDGSFSVDNIICGQTPFSYSVNGGLFGPIPTDLVPGTYSVVIEDANNLQSAPISVVITEPNYTINNPVGVNASTCLNETSAIISATSTLSSNSTGSQVITFDLLAQPTEVGGNSSFPAIASNPNIISTAMVNALPANATVTSVTFTMSGLVPQGFSWGSDVGFGFTGSVSANYAAGAGAPASTTAFNYTRTLPIGSIDINGGVVNLNYYDLYNDNAGDECIFPIGTAVGTLTINYSFPDPANITWWDAATGGTQIGTGNTLESIGTSVLIDGSTAGVYNFFAQGEIAGCSSPSRTLVTTTVNALPTVTVSSDDADNTVCENTMITLTAAGASTYIFTGGVTNATAFNIVSTETFIITGTDANGCVNTDAITITVNTIPTVNAISDVTNNEICGSGDVTLTSTGTAVSYSWDNSVVEGVTFNTSSTNTYTVTGVDAIGCENTASVTITVFTLPTVTATSDLTNDQLCVSGDVTLTAGGNATSYTWDNSVVDGVAFNTSATDTYTVTGTDANGCENTAVITITVNALPTVTVTSDDADNTVCENAMITLTGAGAATYSYTGAAVDATAFAITATETFTVTGTDANGCTNTDVITITVNTLPTVSATSNDADNAVCVGSSVIVTGTGASTYTFTGGISNGVAFTPTASNTYSVTGTDANGCVNTGSITITVNQLPIVDLAPYTSPVCAVVTSYSLTNVSPLTGVFSGPNVTGTTFNPSAAGVGVHPITYTVTDINGCVGSDVENITVGDCSGIEENSSASVTVYPNPTNGEFTLSISNANFSNINISIVDIHGKLVYNEINVSVAQDFIKQINVSDLARGVYFVKLNNGSDISTQKLIIQ